MKKGEGEVTFGSWETVGWKGGFEKFVGLGSESKSSSGASTSDSWKLDVVLTTVWFESSESMRGELEEKLGRGEEVRSESEMRVEWHWKFDG